MTMVHRCIAGIAILGASLDSAVRDPLQPNVFFCAACVETTGPKGRGVPRGTARTNARILTRRLCTPPPFAGHHRRHCGRNLSQSAEPAADCGLVAALMTRNLRQFVTRKPCFCVSQEGSIRGSMAIKGIKASRFGGVVGSGSPSPSLSGGDQTALMSAMGNSDMPLQSEEGANSCSDLDVPKMSLNSAAKPEVARNSGGFHWIAVGNKGGSESGSQEAVKTGGILRSRSGLGEGLLQDH